jgi:hypothetical protein
MALPACVHPGSLLWSGEHWINYLRPAGGERDSGMVSLYHTACSVAGSGNVAFVLFRDELATEWSAICTDNRRLVEFTQTTMIRGKVEHFDRELPILDAEFHHCGDMPTSAWWEIRTAEHRIRAAWRQFGHAVVMYRPDPALTGDFCFFSALLFTDEAEIHLDGSRVDGQPYTRTIWREVIGGDRSSCVVGLAETFVRV